MSSKHIFSCVLLATGLLASCSNSAPVRERFPNPAVGSTCKVQFRRDALGAASTLPVPPMTDNINGADTNVVGTLEAINREWVVLKQNDIKKTWIPREVILLIEVEQQKSGA